MEEQSLDFIIEKVRKQGIQHKITNMRLKEVVSMMETRILSIMKEAGMEHDLFILVDTPDAPLPAPYYICLEDNLILTGIIPVDSFEEMDQNELITKIHWDVLSQADYEELNDPVVTGMLATNAELFGSVLNGRRPFRLRFLKDIIPLLEMISECLEEDTAENEAALKLQKELAFLTYLENRGKN